MSRARSHRFSQWRRYFLCTVQIAHKRANDPGDLRAGQDCNSEIVMEMRNGQGWCFARTVRLHIAVKKTIQHTTNAITAAIVGFHDLETSTQYLDIDWLTKRINLVSLP